MHAAVRRSWSALFLVLGLAGCAADPAAAPVEGQLRGSDSAAPAPTLPSDARVVVLGDSYTVGSGSADGTGYLDDLGTESGWTLVPVAQSGTGYVNPSRLAGQSVFGDRVTAVAAEEPDLVLVQGSTNDVGVGAAGDVGRAAARLFADLSAQLPGVPVVVLGPLDAPAVDAAGVREVRDELSGAAQDADLPFIDPIAEDWLPSADLFADQLHPDDAGYAEYAHDLAGALRDLGL